MDKFVSRFKKLIEDSHSAIQQNNHEYFMQPLQNFEGLQKQVAEMYQKKYSTDLIIKSFQSRSVGWEIIPIVLDRGIYEDASIGSVFTGGYNGNNLNCSVYAVSAPEPKNEEVSIYTNFTPGKLFNLNNNSSYRVSFDKTNTTINFFLRKDLLKEDPKTLSGEDLKVYILDIRGCVYHFVNIRCGAYLAENSINILTNNLTVAIVKQLTPITPDIVADVLGTNRTIAEDLIDAYDVDAGCFTLLPWMI